MQQGFHNEFYLLSAPSEVKSLKDSLSEKGLFSKPQGVEKYICACQDDVNLSGMLGIGLSISQNSQVISDLCEKEEKIVNVDQLNVQGLSEFFPGYLVWIRPQRSSRKKSNSPTSLTSALYDFIDKNHPTPFTPPIIIPNRYTIYGSMVLFSSGSFTDDWWSDYCQYLRTENLQVEFFKIIADLLRVTHIATNAPILEQDEMRRPSGLIPLYGDFGKLVESSQPTNEDFENAYWVETKQNGIHQAWAPLYTMFSRGNVKEKARVLKFPNIKDNIIVDMYAGIGYFTFSYIKAGANLALCWEMNPWSVQGLVRGARANRWNCRVVHSHDELLQLRPNDEIIVFQEDNRNALQRIQKLFRNNGQHFHYHQISHINMGLLPTSQPTWQPSVEIALLSQSSKTYLHIHENVAHQDVVSYGAHIKATLSVAMAAASHHSTSRCPIQAVHVERIKTFAPGIWHLCFDFALDRTL